MTRHRAEIESLDAHPNLAEILGILAQLPHIPDGDLPGLAAGWHNTVYLSDARTKALEPDCPLILEVLSAFDALQALFADDLAGEADYLTVEPETTVAALKAVRDAIAGAYARPVLTRGEYTALMRAWRGVYPVHTVDEPDLGPNAEQVKALLATLALLGTRCHDEEAALLFERVQTTAWQLDERIRDAARAETWRAACLTSRRRLWALVRRSGQQGLRRPCPNCPPSTDGSGEDLVMELCLDAACALLVADAVDDNLTDALVLPLRDLIPAPRSAH